MEVRCPHCHAPIDLPSDTSLSDITCPSCGSSFGLLGEDETVSFKSTKTKTLGHFELIEQIGVGGFGCVWRAHDTELDRTVAVKIPRKGKLDPSESDQFLREARAAAQLRHPNIVSVHEVGREEGTVFIVSDYVEGVTLGEWLTGKKLTAREAVELCAKIADALHHAHEAGIVHRDLKPGNIMLDADGVPHIMDFGLARREAGEVTMTVEGRVLGTPAYMSPEQAKGEAHQADRRSDVYSLGVILFELLTGERPFRGSVRMLLHQVIHEESPSPRKLAGTTPRDLETICLKCLEKEPSKRYVNAKELGHDLRHFLKGEAIKARPVSKMERGWRWCRRKPLVASLLATVAALLVTGTIVSSRFAVVADEEAEQRRCLLYISDMNVAQLAWEENNVGRVVEMLKRQVPKSGQEDLRGFEWYYLWGLLERRFQTPSIPLWYNPNSITFSPNDKLLAVGLSDQTVVLFDATTRKHVQTLGSPNLAQVWFSSQVAFSPVGDLLAYVDGKNVQLRTITYEDDITVQDQGKIASECDVTTIVFSCDGSLLAVLGQDETVHVWDMSARGSRTLLKTIDGVWSAQFLPTDNRLAVRGNGGKTQVYDVSINGEPVDLPRNSDFLGSLLFSPDGRYVASGGADNTVVIWDPQSGQTLHTLEGHVDTVLSLSFSPDGALLASGGRDNLVKIWDVASGEEVETLKGHSSAVEVAFSHDGRTLASASGYAVLFWDMSRGRSANVLKHDRSITDVVLTPDGRTIMSLVAGDRLTRAALRGVDEVMQWDVVTGKKLKPIEVKESTFSIAISPKALLPDILLATGTREGRLDIWNAKTGEHIKALSGHADVVRVLAFSPSGKMLASGCNDGTAKLWTLDTYGLTRTFPAHKSAVQSVAFSSDEEILAVGSRDYTATLWDLNMESEKPLLHLKEHKGAVTSMAFSSDGQTFVTGGWDKRIKLWDLKNANESLATLTGHGLWISSVVFSKDGRTLFSAGGDRTVKVWDVETRQQKLTFKGHAGGVTSFVLSPDENALVSGARDDTIRVWRAATKAEVASSKSWRRLCATRKE